MTWLFWVVGGGLLLGWIGWFVKPRVKDEYVSDSWLHNNGYGRTND